jgi:hypothetical protein
MRPLRWLARGGRFRWDRPVPGVEDTGLIGWAKPPPAGPVPPARHDTGGVEYTVRVWKCGCIRLWDGDGRVTGVTPCQAPSIDDELRNILRDQH